MRTKTQTTEGNTTASENTVIGIRHVTEEEIQEALTRIHYRTELGRALDTLPDDVPGLAVSGRAIQSVRLAVTAFNQRRNDNRKFKVLAGTNGEVLVKRS